MESPEGFDDGLLAGEVLAARLTAPACTPPFGRAVVTDGGTLASHASLVAREHGIPAVGGAGDATRRPREGRVLASLAARARSSSPDAPSRRASGVSGILLRPG